MNINRRLQKLRGKRGNMSLLALFMVFIFVLVVSLVYTTTTIYTNYQSAQLTLERALNAAIAENIKNTEVRDVVVVVSRTEVPTIVSQNLQDRQLVKDGDTYTLYAADEQVKYTLRDISYDGDNYFLSANTTFTMPVPWGKFTGDIEIPMTVTARILFNDRSVIP